MTRGVVLGTVWVIGVAGLAAATMRGARELTLEELRAEMARNRRLAAYVARNGLPDLAETHSLATRPPWDKYEVTLYYLDSRTEVGFARAFILGRPDIQLERYERTLTDEQLAALSTLPRLQRGGPAARAEEAARRAEQAAARVEAAAESAERAAERAEAITTRMESAFHRALRK
jgi:hypothetical protein